MKLITWNCNMAFRKKFEKITALNPDLLILQECENRSKLEDHLKSLKYNQIIWCGDHPHKGVGIISFNKLTIELNKKHNPEFQYVIPIKLKVGKRKINLFSIWAMPHKNERSKDYVGQIWGAINFYEKELNEESILIGDFNSNAIWDKKNRIGNHSDVVSFLNDKNIYSLYHQKNKLAHGQEEHPTLFLLKQLKKPYHMDYCFASKSLYSKKTTVEVGVYNDWIKLSDHMPVVIDTFL